MRGRLRRESLAAQARAKPPFPVSLLFNVRLFYIIALAIMVIGIAAGAIFSGTLRGRNQGTPLTPTPTPTEEQAEATPEAQPRQVKTYPAEPEMTIDTSKQYFAVIETEKGRIRLELFDDEAPHTVNNFVFLSRDGFYNGLTFHFVRPGLVAQAGDPTCTAEAGVTCTGIDGPGYTLPKETNSQEHVAGAVAMAEDTSVHVAHGSQFYIAYTDLPNLNGRNTVFGRVVEGMDVVQALTPREWRDPNAPAGDKILSITIEEV